ncbi:MAG: CDP-alcohol phosphatidyltransferase family protein [Acidimicrobiales bacterium]
MTADMVTGAGFLIGVGACWAIATERWTAALVLWLLNRLLDGLDGAVARNSAGGPTDLGGFLDIMADFAIYGGVVAAAGYAVPEARVAALVTFLAYYLNGTALLAWSSLAERTQAATGDRGLVFPSGLAEGSETIIAYVILLLFPEWARTILWIWAIVVAITVVQRVVFVTRQLR